MNRQIASLIPLLVAALALVAGCATAPAAPEYPISDEVLRDPDNDVLFATEFPVTSKADALQRADEARKAGDIDKALFFYVKALKYEPEDADLLAAIGLLHQYQGNSVMAVRAYTMALGVRPDFRRVLEARGLILLGHDERERARRDLERAVQLEPDASWQALNGLGLLSDHEGDHAAAIAHYNSALAINPASGAVLNNSGYSKLLAGDLEGAELDLRKAAEVLGHTQAWVNLGLLYARRAQYDAAVDTLQKVLSEPEALNKVAEVSMEQRDFGTAVTLLEQAVRVSPTYFPAAEENLSLARLGTENE